MTVRDLIASLREHPEGLDVEILSDDGLDSREVGSVYVRQVERGPLREPRTYGVVILASGMEGL